MYQVPQLQENRRTPQQRMEDEMRLRQHSDRKNAMRQNDLQDRIEKERLIKGQPHSLAYMTDQEMEAMNELRREPGLRGRLARKGSRKKMDFVGGIPAFFDPSADPATQRDDSNTGHAYTASEQAWVDNAVAQSHADRGNDGGGGFSGVSQDRFNKLQKEFDDYKGGEEKRKEEAIEGYRGEKRQKLTDEFKGYQDRYKSLEDQYDLSGERSAMQGLAGEAKGLGTQFGRDIAGVRGDISGYEGKVSGLTDDVSAIGKQQAKLGEKLGGLAEQALDPASSAMYDRNRRMLAGQAEQTRSASNLAAQEQLNRGAASTGMSPEKLALAQAQLKQGQGAMARQDALSSAMGAQQMTGQQLSQGANLLGQQGNFGLNQANLYGQQAGLNLNAAGLAQNRGGLLGQAAGFQSGLLGQRGGFQGQSANLLQNQLQGKAGMMGQQVGMTEAQLQDVVAQQNQAFEKEMAEKGYAMQRSAAAANRPQGPSQMSQLLSTAATVAPIVAAFSDRGLKKNIRNAKDQDLLGPEEIDGFLSNLYAKQYNYKDPKHGEGKQVGIMAQDLENTQLGKQMVENTPEGKQVNYGKGLGLVMASQARINERLNSIGA